MLQLDVKQTCQKQSAPQRWAPNGVQDGHHTNMPLRFAHHSLPPEHDMI